MKAEQRVVGCMISILMGMLIGLILGGFFANDSAQHECGFFENEPINELPSRCLKYYSTPVLYSIEGIPN